MQYRVARAAKLALAGVGEWEKMYRVLENGDIRSYTDADRKKPWVGRKGTNEDSDEPVPLDAAPTTEESLTLEEDERMRREGTGPTRRTLSWIWLMMPIVVEDRMDKNDDILRSEWCRSQARVK